MSYIHKSAIEVIEFVKSKGIEIRFSSEDSFRSDLVDLLSIYRAVDQIGVNRVVSVSVVLKLDADLNRASPILLAVLLHARFMTLSALYVVWFHVI